MRHRVAGKALSRSPSHRRSLRRNMAASLIQYGAIRTTEAKAKELRRFVERLITTAKKGTLHARRQVIATLGDRDIFDADGQRQDRSVVQKLFDEIAPRYADRPGGYTRIIRLSERRIGDAGVQVLLQLVEETPSKARGGVEGKTSRRRRRAAKRREAAAAAGGEGQAATSDKEQPAETTEEQAVEEQPAEGGDEKQAEADKQE